jgi:mediator of RNA polymerase II transcription subunit 13
MEQSPGKYLPSGLVLVECPDEVKTSGSHTISVSSVTEYFQALSKSWSVKSFVTSLARIIKDIQLTSNISTNQKESSNIPCTVRTFSSFSTCLIQGTS